MVSFTKDELVYMMWALRQSSFSEMSYIHSALHKLEIEARGRNVGFDKR